MKETINVSLASRPFTMDRDAYAMLQSYLNEVGRRLSASDRETVADLESRIADILASALSSPMMVVTAAMVDNAISRVGRPEDFGPLRDGEKSYGTYSHVNCQGRRELRRSTSDCVIGGVCGGIAEWCNVDSRAVRLLTFLLTFFGGVSVFVYLILWIILPKDNR